MVLAVIFSCALFTHAQSNPKVLVVYYSRDGHTQKVAQVLLKRFNADGEQLIDKKKRIGLIGASSAGKDAIAKKSTSIEPLKKNPLDYDIILIGTPSWFGNPTPAVRTFVKLYSLKGKKIGVFGTAHMTGIEACLFQLAELITRDAPAVIPVLALRHNDLEEPVLKDKVEAFYKKIMEGY
jgi:flavodoxin